MSSLKRMKARFEIDFGGLELSLHLCKLSFGDITAWVNVPGDIVPLSGVPDGLLVRVEDWGCVDVALLKRSSSGQCE